jgi:DNA invertase Pin-like site-specific DNA recombinase
VGEFNKLRAEIRHYFSFLFGKILPKLLDIRGLVREYVTYRKAGETMKRITKIEENAADKGKLKVAAYCRVSTDQSEQLLSLDTQKAHYEAWIKGNPDWEYAGLYYDEGLSGTKKESRPELMRMISDCEHGLIDFVVTKSISRFARNTTDCLELVRKLLGLNIPIFFEKENINTGKMESELLLSIMGSLAEEESTSISQNNKWGITHRFKNGTFKCSYTPYGYDWDKEKGEIVINQEQAEIVRFIFSQTLAGVGTHDIAKILEDRGIPTKRGGKWTGHTVNGIIRNEKYTGDCLFQKSYTDSNFNRHTNYGEKPQYYVKDHHEALVSHEEFEAANAMVDRRREEKGIAKNTDRYTQRYPFSGKVFCGQCGGKLKRKTYSSTGQVVLACESHLQDKNSCSLKYISNDAVEAAFARMMNKLVYGRNKILKPLLKALENENQTDLYLEIHRMELQIEDLSGKKQTLKNLFAQGILEPVVYTQEMNRMTGEVQKIMAEKEALAYQAGTEMEHMTETKKLLKYAERQQMLDAFDGDLFTDFVEKIVMNSRTELTFFLKCGLKLTERIG